MRNPKPELPLHVALLAVLPPWLPTALIVFLCIDIAITVAFFLLG
ncbi:MAG: hypothetical protein NTV52_31150 [Acidobacteria bacterium]|jgi:hypothetical protein|nr:hypothetical protein [Acidobacteriota bacterium]